MTTPIPPRNSARYKAGAFLHRWVDNLPEANILEIIDFGARPSTARDNLRRALESGWLTRLPGGLIGCSPNATAHYEALVAPPPAPYKGEKVPPRQIDVINRKAYAPPKRVVRADAFDNSLAAIPSFWAKVTA